MQIFECAWLVDEEVEPGRWHKDYPHYDGMDLDSYQCPEAIYLAVYLRDMTEETGPTQLVPTSHRDVSLQQPADEGSDPRVVSFTTRAQDVVVWDQRAWHRRGPGGGGCLADGGDARRRSLRSGSMSMFPRGGSDANIPCSFRQLIARPRC